MDFTNNFFIFIFLPFSLIIYFLSGKKVKNWVMIFASILFIFSAGIFGLIVVISLTILNYFIGLQIDKHKENENTSNDLYVAGLLANVFFLAVFKFFSTYGSLFYFEFLPAALAKNVRTFVMPLGLSYLTFQNITYLVEIHYGTHPPEENFFEYLEYSIMFPKILTGPIMIYADLKEQIANRQVDFTKISDGIRRFILGFAKKALIADTLARTINPSFDLSEPLFSSRIAWFMLASYTLQIYFDFSGYTDMAIGLGKMFGFQFIENFNFPYIAQSITDFWRRWHISLSIWIRQYIFTPLEFKRRRVKRFRQETNLLATFLLVGLWHGITPTFIIWGIYYGIALAVESAFFSKWLKKTPRFLRHIYTLFVVMIGWVFFRSNSIKFALQFIKRLFSFGADIPVQPFHLTNPLPIIDPSVWIAFTLGVFFSTPIPGRIRDLVVQKIQHPVGLQAIQIISDVFLLILFIFSFAAITSAAFVGNIYGAF